MSRIVDSRAFKLLRGASAWLETARQTVRSPRRHTSPSPAAEDGQRDTWGPSGPLPDSVPEVPAVSSSEAEAFASSTKTTEADVSPNSTLHRVAESVADAGAEQVTQMRFTLLEQRLTLLSERLSLVSERVMELGGSRQTSRSSALTSGIDTAELARLAERIAVLQSAAQSPHMPRAPGRETLRPPKVPEGLSVEPVQQVNSGFAPALASRSEPLTGQRTAAGPTMTGTLSGLSLGALFSLLEFDRCGGVLSLRNEDRVLELTFKEGALIRCEVDGIRSAASQAVREAFAWPTSTFSFRRDDVQEDSDEPQSVNALLLDALRQHDEDMRLG